MSGTKAGKNAMDGKLRSRRYGICWGMRAYHPEVEYIYSHTVNLSCTGVLFVSPAPYRLGALIRMEITPGNGIVIGCVVRIRREQIYRKGYYAYGASFEHISEESRKILNDKLLEIYREEWNKDAVRVPAAASRSHAVAAQGRVQAGHRS